MAKTSPAALIRQVVSAGVIVIAAGCSTNPAENAADTGEYEQPTAENRFTEVNGLDEEGFVEVVAEQQYTADVRPDRPAQHVVVRGDTLWGISARFLKNPWLWPQVWEYNPAIKNPDLIYPGDIIALEYIDGQPRMVLSRNGETLNQAGSLGQNAAQATRVLPTPFPKGVTSVERLSPKIRVESLQDAIPTIPGDAIRQFLTHPRVVSAREIDRAPYVVGNYDGRLASASGHQIFVRGNLPAGQQNFGIFRNNKALKDPITGETLGYEVTHVADAKLQQRDDPATFLITSNKMETLSGDRLMAVNDQDIVYSYTPRMPKMTGDGRIISLVDAITQSGRNQIVVLNMGERAGVNVGDVMAIESRGGAITDSFRKRGQQQVQLPNTRTGVLMVFKTFDKVAYALVMESTRPIHIDDIITGI